MDQPITLDAGAAAIALGVSRATLYAYVSRHLIAATPDPVDPRRRRYAASDIARLQRTQARGRKPQAIAAETLDWGLPALPSRITMVEPTRLSYRGQDAAALAGTAHLEAVARLLWDCDGDDPFAAAAPAKLAPPDLPSLPRALAGLALALPLSHPLPHRNPVRLRQDGADLLRQLAGWLLGTTPARLPLHRQLAGAWKLQRGAADLVRSAMVQLADHELNPSTFAVRVVASTGAALPACLAAGLAALSGPRHGGATPLAQALLSDAAAGDPATVVAQWLQRGPIPAFGQPLYPTGDPRAAWLLARLPADPVRDAVIGAVDRISGVAPNIDFALAALVRALGLPDDAGFTIFALARSAGWIAHALEQHLDGRLIRPRAAYVGVRPASL